VNTIVAQITSRTHRTLETTQLLLRLNSPEGKQSGLRQDSVVNCVNLATLHETKILQILGSLSGIMYQIDACLKAALGLP
jgi:mRNA interferase MazF